MKFNAKFWTSVDNLDSPLLKLWRTILQRCCVWFSLWSTQLKIFEKIEDKSCPSWLPVNHPLPEAQGTRLGSLCQPCPACTEYNLRQKCLIFMEFVILIWTASHFRYVVKIIYRGNWRSWIIHLTFQEMIDSDIKADFDDVMTSNQLGFTNVDSLDLLNNLDDLDTPFKFDSRYHGVDEVLNHPPQWNQQPSSQDITALNSTYFDDSLSNNVMVNPNSVMPVHQQFQQQQRPPSHTPSPVPPQGGPQQPHLTVNTQINTYSQHHNLQHPTPSPNNQVNPMSPHPHPTYPSHMTTGGQIHYQYHPAQTNGQVNMVGKTLKVLPPVSSPMQQVANFLNNFQVNSKYFSS